MKAPVDQRITYREYYKRDWLYVAEKGEGNCAVFAYSYDVELKKAGYEPGLPLCMLPDEVPHATARVM